MDNSDDGETVDISITAAQLTVIEQAAASRGCTVPEFILEEALLQARVMIGRNEPALKQPSRRAGLTADLPDEWVEAVTIARAPDSLGRSGND